MIYLDFTNIISISNYKAHEKIYLKYIIITLYVYVNCTRK